MSLFIRLRELRGDRPQQDIAKALGMTQPTYSRYEKGIHEPDLKTLRLIATYFGVTTDWLLGMRETRNGNPRAEDAERKLTALKKGLAELLKAY